MAGYGGIWRYMAGYGGIWRDMVGGIWRDTVRYGEIHQDTAKKPASLRPSSTALQRSTLYILYTLPQYTRSYHVERLAWSSVPAHRKSRAAARTKVLARKREQRPPCGATASLGEKVQRAISCGRLGGQANSPTQPVPTTQPNPKSTILLLGPQSSTVPRSLTPYIVPGSESVGKRRVSVGFTGLSHTNQARVSSGQNGLP